MSRKWKRQGRGKPFLERSLQKWPWWMFVGGRRLQRKYLSRGPQGLMWTVIGIHTSMTIAICPSLFYRFWLLLVSMSWQWSCRGEDTTPEKEGDKKKKKRWGKRRNQNSKLEGEYWKYRNTENSPSPKHLTYSGLIASAFMSKYRWTKRFVATKLMPTPIALLMKFNVSYTSGEDVQFRETKQKPTRTFPTTCIVK